MSTVAHRFIEYFTLRDARTTAQRITDESRASISSALTLGRQKAEAADALWSAGHTAEGLALAAVAFRSTVEAAEAFGFDGPSPSADSKGPIIDEGAEVSADAPEDDVLNPKGIAHEDEKTGTLTSILRSRGISERKIDRVREAERSLRATSLPALNSQVTQAHTKLYEELAYSRTQIDQALELTALTPNQIGRTRLSRHILAVGLLIAAGVLIYFIVRPPPQPDFEASDTYAGFPPNHLHDGNEDTEWLLPNRSTGWARVAVDPPQRIETLKLLNSHNRHYNDRATNQFRVEFLRDGEIIGTRAGNFPALEPNPDWIELEAGFDDVDAVRFVVLSFHRNGGGLAEVIWE